MKRIKIVISTLVLLFGALLASCSVSSTPSSSNKTPSTSEAKPSTSTGTLHYHTYSNTWTSNDTKHWHAATCGHNVVNSVANHTFGDWYVKKEPTDSATGLKVRTCSVCGYEQSQTIDKLEHTHTYSSAWSSNATSHWHASTCGHDVVSSKNSHNYSAWTVVQNATETSTGLKKRTCNTCGYEQSQTIDKVEHTHKYETTWTSDDDYHWHTSTCGHDVVSSKSLHNYGSWVTVKEATETSTGLKKRTCNTCGYEQSEMIDKLDHTHTYSRSWTNDENYHWHAATCGHDVVSEKSSHTYGRWTIIQNATTSSTGLKVRYCSVCNYEDEQVIEQIHNHTYETTWTSDENYHWHASTCGHDVVSGKESHEFDDWIIVRNATVSSTGLRKKVCDVCGYEYKEEIPKLDPSKLFTITWVNWDGTVLEKDENVLYGSMPSYDGETPIRESTVSSSFKFSGWSPTVNKVTKNQTYTAQFIESELSYTFYFDLNGGTSPSYVKSKVVKTLDAKDFFFDVTKANYKFRGWSYNDTKVFDEAGNLIKNVKLLPEMTFKAIFNQTNKVTIISNMADAGEISQGGEYPYNVDIDLYAHPYQGYEFVGWYSKGFCLSNDEELKHKLWSEDETIEARFKYASFNMNTESYNSDYGLVAHKDTRYNDGETLTYYDNEEFIVEYTSKVSIGAYSKTNIRFLGWYDNDNNLVSRNNVYTFLMPNYDYKLIAKWNYFTISYEYDSDVEFDDTVLNYYTTEMTNLVLPEPKKTGYTFVGWYYNDQKYTQIDPKSTTNYKFVAKFKANMFTVTTDTSTIYYINGDFGWGSSYNVEYGKPFTFPIATQLSNKEYSYTLFEGWKCNDKLITDSSGYIENWNIPQNIVLTPSFTKKEDNILYFGSYPQSEVTNKTLIDDLNAKAGELPSISNLNLWKDYGYYYNGNIKSYMYYIDIDVNDDNSYDYRGVYFTKYRPYLSTSGTSSNQSNNGYNANKVYWFKYDSIKWRILEQNDGKALILLDLALDSQDYNYEPNIRENVKDYQGNVSGRVYGNNYMYSHIRSWLNTSFYDTAFSDLQKKIINITNVDNSLKSTTESSNYYVCENTNDKMFLLSVEEINKYFKNYSERQASATAYASCQGIYKDSNGFCNYRLRSPCNDYGYSGSDACSVSKYGDVCYYDVNYTNDGIRAACRINL